MAIVRFTMENGTTTVIDERGSVWVGVKLTPVADVVVGVTSIGVGCGMVASKVVSKETEGEE